MENSPDDMSVLLQFAKFSKGFRISDFDEFVQEYIGFGNLDFLGRLAYPNQWQIRLTDPDLRERLIRTGRTRIKNRSCWMYPLNQQEIRGFVHWLPNSVTNDQLTRQLQLYGEVLFVKSEEKIINGGKVESDQRYYGLILPYGTIKEDLPHFWKINGYLCLLVVRGREPACYHCKEVGHRRAECSKYKAKLIGYCNREPNTSSRRLKPRGRRHVQAEIEVRAETSRNEVSSIDNAVFSEKKIPVESVTEPHLSASEDREHIETQGKATGSIEKVAVSFSEIQTKDILETIQQIQQKTKEDLQQMLKSAEEDIALFLTRVFSTHTRDQRRSTEIESTWKILEQETRSEELEIQAEEAYVPEDSTTTVETTEIDSSSNAVIKEIKNPEIQFELPTMHQVKANTVSTVEEIYNISEEKLKFLQSTDNDSIGNAGTSSILLMLKETKQAASYTFENTFKTLEEFTEEIKAPDTPSKASDTDVDSKLTEEDAQDLLGMLEQAKVVAGQSDEIFKKIETGILSVLSEKSIDTEARLTEDDIYFAKQMLANTKENATEILQNTFKKLEENVVKQFETTTKSADESKSLSKIANVTTQPNDTLDTEKQICKRDMMVVEVESSEKASSIYESPEEIIQTSVELVTKVQDDFEAAEIFERNEESKKMIMTEKMDIEKQICKRDMMVVEVESSEKASSIYESPEEILQTNLEPVTKVQGDFKAAEIFERNEENKKMIMTEKSISEAKDIEYNIYKVVQEDMDKLKMNLKQIFTSVQDKTDLLEASTLLKQVESEVIEMVEETKNKWKMAMENI